MSEDRTIEFLKSRGVTRVSLECKYNTAIDDEDDLGLKLDGVYTIRDIEYSFEGTLEEFEEYRRHYNLWDVESDSDLGRGYDLSLIITDGCLYGEWDNSSPDYCRFPRRVPVISDYSDIIVFMQYEAYYAGNLIYTVEYDEDKGFSFEVNV